MDWSGDDHHDDDDDKQEHRTYNFPFNIAFNLLIAIALLVLKKTAAATPTPPTNKEIKMPRIRLKKSENKCQKYLKMLTEKNVKREKNRTEWKIAKTVNVRKMSK